MEIGVQTCGHKNNPQKHAIKGKRMKAYSGRDRASTGKVGVIKESKESKRVPERETKRVVCLNEL